MAALVDRAGLRTELEETRVAFHRRLDSLSEAEWREKSANPAWTVGQVMSHIAQILEFYAGAVENARRGKATLPPLPLWLLDRLNALGTRFGARRATPQSVARKYDAAHARLLALLEGIREEEWAMTTRSPLSPGGFLTVETAFRSPALHLAEHAAQIRQV